MTWVGIACQHEQRQKCRFVYAEKSPVFHLLDLVKESFCRPGRRIREPKWTKEKPPGRRACRICSKKYTSSR